MMDILYQLFYTIFSMSCMAIVLLPVVLILRILLRRLSGNLTLVLWGILFLRAVCPVGMSSPVCLYEPWNRQFHRLTRSLGLQILPDKGLLTGWEYVFQGNIETTMAYRICTLIWLAGVVFLIAGTVWKQLRLGTALRKHSKHLFDRIYQSEIISCPVRTGMLWGRIYLPEGLLAKEMRDIISHQQLRKVRMDDAWRRLAFVVCCIHWWNPGLWLAYYLLWKDQNDAGDVSFLKYIGKMPSYGAQVLANMKTDQEQKISFSLVTGYEGDLSKRAGNLLYVHPEPLWKKGIAAFLLTLVVFWAFCLSAFQGQKPENQTASGTLFADGRIKNVTDQVIARCDTQIPSGSAVTLELVVEKGTYERNRGYRGKCALRMKGEKGQRLAVLELDSVFDEQDFQSFQENVSLETADYNEDGTMELAIGQCVREGEDSATEGNAATSSAVSGKKFKYYIINIENKKLQVISPAITLTEVTKLQEGSIKLSYVQGAAGVITVTEGGATNYYVWDASCGQYVQKEMTEEQLEKRRKQGELSGQEQTHYSLKNDKEKKVMDVSVRKQENGGLSIENVRINPEGLDKRTGTKTMTNIEGYYLDLQWAESDQDKKKYAVLSYNGTNGRTFSLYDVEKGKKCYQPASGNEELQKLFREYGADDITFEKDGAVVYSLLEIQEDDVLKVNFAASAKDDVTVKGSYLYRLSTQKINSLQYSRE